MSDDPRVILLEFNELTPALLDRFIADGKLPNFRRFREQSTAWITEAEEREPYLEPWIQWVTVHSGLNYADHGVFHLNEGHKLRAQQIWDVVSDRGGSVWVCGSMNVRHDDRLRGCVLPDPWNTHVKPNPVALEPFFRFVQQNVLEHTNDQVPLQTRDYARFLGFLAAHGLSAPTVSAVARQLASERFGGSRWRRAALLDKFQFDVFRWYFRTHRPTLSTFFLNSTAHYQHAYWDAMEPELFGRQDAGRERGDQAEAILYGYQQMDTLIGRFLRLAGKHTTLVLATAMSQEPWIGHDNHGGGSFYRPRDFHTVTALAGIGSSPRISPVMTEQFFLEFGSEPEAIDAEAKLKALRFIEPDQPLLSVERKGTRIFAGCSAHRDVATGVHIGTAAAGGRRSPFFDLFYKVDTSKTGRHHPDGVLWVRRAPFAASSHAEKLPLAAVAPSLLRMLGIAPPEHMRQRPVDLHRLAA